MSEAANIDSIDVLKDIKLSLLKFQEAATVSLGDAESETHRVLMWIQTEQDSFWQHQIRKREELVTRCKEAVRMKKIFKDSSGRQQSAIDEEKALRIALRNLEEAQQKLKLVRKWARALPKEIENYKGSVQRFATTVESQIPTAIGHLEKLTKKLDAYIAVQTASFGEAIGAGGASGSTVGLASMGRGSAISGGIAPDEITRLKGLLATPEIRGSAPMVTEIKLQAPTIPAEQQAPAMLPVTERRHPPGDAKVLIATTSSSAGRLFLHHAVPVVPNDSGWSILPADATADLQWEAIRFADLLAARLDMADLLGLPVRFSVMIDSSGISDVADAQQPAWRRHRRRARRRTQSQTGNLVMGVYEGRGQLTKAYKNLQMRWAEAKSNWEDSASKHFEDKFINPIEMDLKNAVGAMDHMAAILSQVRKDCQ